MFFDNSVTHAFNINAAKKYGINGALLLNRIVWSIKVHSESNDKRFFIDGNWWMFDTAKSLAKHFHNLISEKTVRRSLKAFEDDGLLSSMRNSSNLHDQTKWYSLDQKKWHKLLVHIDHHDVDNLSTSNRSRCPHPTGHGDHIQPVDVSTSSSLNNHSNNHSNSLTNIPAKADEPSAIATGSTYKNIKYSIEEMNLANDWLAYAKDGMPWKKAPRSWSPDSFASALIKVRKAITTNDQGMRLVFDFVRNDSFWASVALSPHTLLNKSNSNGNRKIDNILISMRGNKHIKDRQENEGIEAFLKDDDKVLDVFTSSANAEKSPF